MPIIGWVVSNQVPIPPPDTLPIGVTKHVPSPGIIDRDVVLLWASPPGATCVTPAVVDTAAATPDPIAVPILESARQPAVLFAAYIVRVHVKASSAQLRKWVFQFELRTTGDPDAVVGLKPARVPVAMLLFRLLK